MKAYALIERIMTSLSSKRAFGENTYRDEPILRPASSLENYVPPDIVALKDFGRRLCLERHTCREDYIFRKQAEKAVDIIDDVAPIPPFFIPHPTYRTLNDNQLRAYFSWRHNLKNGEFSDIPAFILLHANELIYLIGADSTEEAFDRLCKLENATNHDYTAMVLRSLLTDFFVYYQPNRSADLLPLDLTRNKQLSVLYDAQTADDDALYDAIAATSAYRFHSSRFFKAHPEISRKAICNAYRMADRYYRDNEPKSWFSVLFGDSVLIFYPLFRSTMFYEETRHPDTYVEVTPLLHYYCENGAWHRITGYESDRSSGLLGNLMKQVDCSLRKAHYDPHPLKEPLLDQTLNIIADDAVYEAIKPTPTRISFDLSKLDDIRRAADATRDSLLVEEDLPPTPVAPPAPVAVNRTALDDGEFDVLCGLLAGRDVTVLATAHQRMLSVICDSINEKLFDTFCDSVIDFDGDTPYLINDYIDDLKGLTSS